MQPNGIYRLALAQSLQPEPRRLVAAHGQRVVDSQRSVAVRVVATEVQCDLNREFVPGVYRRFQFTQQHRLQPARELELQQTFVQE